MKTIKTKEIIDSTKRAGDNGGWWLVLIVAIIATSAWYILSFNPAKEFKQEILEPAGQRVGVIESQCPDGWESNRERVAEVVYETCLKTIDGVRWVVSLNRDGDFEHGVPIGGDGEIVFDEAKVPEWP
jgi:hypothetical protein